MVCPDSVGAVRLLGLPNVLLPSQVVFAPFRRPLWGVCVIRSEGQCHADVQSVENVYGVGRLEHTGSPQRVLVCMLAEPKMPSDSSHPVG